MTYTNNTIYWLESSSIITLTTIIDICVIVRCVDENLANRNARPYCSTTRSIDGEVVQISVLSCSYVSILLHKSNRCSRWPLFYQLDFWLSDARSSSSAGAVAWFPCFMYHWTSMSSSCSSCPNRWLNMLPGSFRQGLAFCPRTSTLATCSYSLVFRMDIFEADMLRITSSSVVGSVLPRLPGTIMSFLLIDFSLSDTTGTSIVK